MAQPSQVSIGQFNFQTASFGAHPSSPTGTAITLNDGVVFTLLDSGSGFGDGLNYGSPQPTVLKSANQRTTGERVTRRFYRDNRRITLRLDWNGQSGSFSAWLNALHNVLAVVESITPDNPGCLRLVMSGSANILYADVLEAHIRYEYKELLAIQQLDSLEITFDCKPFLRGPIQYLSNAQSNPGFEAGSGPPVQVFNDSFANVNAYTVLAGATPTVAANVMTVASGATIQFGSPSWAAINTWQYRFQWVTGLSFNSMIHRTNGTNLLFVNVNGAALTVTQQVSGTNHQLATTTATLTNGTFYWVSITQFPTVVGNAPQVQATIFNDSSGAVGTQLATIGPVATFDAVTALSGYMAIQASGASLKIGGNFSGVHTVALFGPGGWTFLSTGTGDASGAWDQVAGNTFASAPVTSYAAARVDVAPAGTLTAQWFGALITSAALIQQTGSAVQTSGNVLGVNVWVKSTGVANSCTQQLLINEYDVNGAFLRQQVVGGTSVAGAQASWTQLSSTYTTGANCVYAVLICSASDATAASANGTIWWENAQVWDQSRLNQTTMPYCELRFPQSPAQLLVTGVLGDVPAPAFTQLGLYMSAWNTGQSATLYFGRKATTLMGAQLVASVPVTRPGGVSGTCVLDSASYGGYYLSFSANAAIQPNWFNEPPSAAAGIYHLLARMWTTDATPASAKVRVRNANWLQGWPGFNSQVYTLYYGEYYGNYILYNPTSAAWNLVDAGYLPMPSQPRIGRADPTQLYAVMAAEFDSGAATATFRANAAALLPVDGEVFTAVINNASNAPQNIATTWFWTYWDYLSTTSPASAYSLESAAIPVPSHAGATTGNQGTGNINLNPGADPLIFLDPRQRTLTNLTTGVNQFTLWASDNTVALYPSCTEFAYYPLYVQPQ